MFFLPPYPQCILEIQVGRGQVYTGTDHVHISLSIPVNHTGKKIKRKQKIQPGTVDRCRLLLPPSLANSLQL